MSRKKNLSYLISQHKKIFIIMGICLFLLELEIFAVAIIKSGNKSTLLISDNKGNIIYYADGKNLTDFNRYYFEKNFGPLEDYEIKLERKEVPFPFRAWFSAGIGVPVGIVLLISFMLKTYLHFFGEEKDKQDTEKDDIKEALDQSKLEKIVSKFSKLNIFAIGAIIFLLIFSYWVIPNLISYVGKVGLETLLRFKWFFLVAGLLITAIFIWFVYLRYLLAKKTLDSKIEVEKHRLQLSYEYGDGNPPMQLDYKKNEDDKDTIEGRIISD
ncbi:conserved membrane hypothetical protein [Candidatus Magnetomoraceae bacterium gMMP-15]